MGSRSRRRVPRGVVIAGVVVLVAALSILAALIPVDYQAALAVVGGVGAASLVALAIRRLWLAERRLLWFGVMAGLMSVLVIVVLIMLAPPIGSESAAPLVPGYSPGTTVEDPDTQESKLTVDIKAYRVTMRPDPETAAILVDEEVIYDVLRGKRVVYSDQRQEFPGQVVTGEPRGFLLREVAIRPLGAGAYAPTTLTLPDGGEATSALCTPLSCPPVQIQLEDFPEDSFFAARGVKTVESVPYVRTETVSWTTRDLSDGITFAYVPQPYHVLRPALTPFIGATSINDWLVGLVAMLGSLLAAPLVIPILEQFAEKVLGESLGRLLGRDREASASSPAN